LLILGIIPARSGSKGIFNKNLALLANKPLIEYTIDAAIQSNSINRLIVSTDSPEIAAISQRCGAETPFLRPAEIAQDDTPGIEPVLHALEWLNVSERYEPNFVMLLQPTSPLRTAIDIQAAIQLAKDKNADAVVSVTPVKQHPYWMKAIGDEGTLKDFILEQPPNTRRQDLPPLYALNGAVYLARRPTLLNHRTFLGPRTFGYVMPPERSIDIDTPWDLHLADLIIRERTTDEVP